VWVCGITDSDDLPLARPFKFILSGHEDAFVLELSSDLKQLMFSTLLGGSGLDRAFGITRVEDGSVCVVGSTTSPDYPAVHGLKSGLVGFEDAFVTAIDPLRSRIKFSTLLGGAGIDEALGVAPVGEERICITGFSNSSDFPTRSGFQSQRGNHLVAYDDVFVTMVDLNQDAPRIMVAPNEVHFGTVRPGRRKRKAILLKNASKQSVPVELAALSAPFAIEGPTRFGIRGGGAHRVEVVLEPSEIGSFEGTLEVTIAESGLTIRVPLDGQAR
jgi:hypothetical protein